ncbi:hypothetical protein HY68_36265 [Streptomyces sp. AcH 505]|nr:hypothetical protein HY68_36265 [Streptomyces sp. AcH 505]
MLAQGFGHLCPGLFSVLLLLHPTAEGQMRRHKVVEQTYALVSVARQFFSQTAANAPGGHAFLQNLDSGALADFGEFTVPGVHRRGHLASADGLFERA